MSKIISKEILDFINEKLDNGFFQYNVIDKISSYVILDFTMSVRNMDEEIYKKLSEEAKLQIMKENEVVEKNEDVNKLYNMLRKEFNPITVNKIIDKLLDSEEEIANKFLESLKRSGNDFFVESAARFFIRTKKNYAKELSTIIPEIKYPYTKSVMCYVLGKIGYEEHIKELYVNFIEFKNNYKSENYFEGPLFALHEMKSKFEF